MEKDYKTVLKRAADEIIEKKSRFIASVAPCKTEEEALSFLSEIKKKYSDATHNVYAYNIAENNIRRYSDDGEPSGTAGVPTLDVILKEELTDVCVVVTRYFGGTLLGAGGLVRAYGKAAKAGLVAAQIVRMIYSEIYEVKCDYASLGKIEYEISANGFDILEKNFGGDVTLTLSTEKSRGEELIKKITESSFGKAIINKTGERFVHKMDGEN